MLPVNTIVHADCMDEERGMPSWPDSSIDAIITDPPYGISSFSVVRVRSVRGAPRRPDGLCQFENTGGNYGQEDVEADFKWVSEAARVLRPGGSFVVFMAQRQMQRVRDAGEHAGLRIRQLWCWCKTNPPPTPRANFSSAVEMGWWMVKPGGVVRWNGGHKQPNYWVGPLYTATFASGRRIHPMQKPEWLMNELIRLFSSEGDIVADPFCGSGTTCLCAFNANRKYIGIEKDGIHASAARDRLRESHGVPQLPFAEVAGA